MAKPLQPPRSRQISPVGSPKSVRVLVVDERPLAGGEEVVRLVRLTNEVEPVTGDWVRSRLDGGHSWIRDRRRRQTGQLAGVVRIVRVQLRLQQRLGAGDMEPVADGRVDPER